MLARRGERRLPTYRRGASPFCLPERVEHLTTGGRRLCPEFARTGTFLNPETACTWESEHRQCSLNRVCYLGAGILVRIDNGSRAGLWRCTPARAERYPLIEPVSPAT